MFPIRGLLVSLSDRTFRTVNAYNERTGFCDFLQNGSFGIVLDFSDCVKGYLGQACIILTVNGVRVFRLHDVHPES